MAGCGRPDEAHIAPYVKQPDGMVLGRPNFYATAMPFGADAIGVLVESHEGRPTKIEGNPDHPSSLGATSAFVQASILNLYDPDRAQTVMYTGEIRSWSAFLDAAQGLATAVKATNGESFRILTGTITSPTLISQIQEIADALSAGEVASMGTGSGRWRARRREAGVWARREHGLFAGQSERDSVAGCGFPGERAGTHCVCEAVCAAAQAGWRRTIR